MRALLAGHLFLVPVYLFYTVTFHTDLDRAWWVVTQEQRDRESLEALAEIGPLPNSFSVANVCNSPRVKNE